MSEVRSAFHHEPRAFLSEQQAAKLFLEHHGRCWKCGSKIGPTEAAKTWTVAHKQALELGGTNEWSNLAPECSNCKPIADASDHKQAGHNRRVATRHVLPQGLRKKSALSKPKGMKFDWRSGRYVRADETEQG